MTHHDTTTTEHSVLSHFCGGARTRASGEAPRLIMPSHIDHNQCAAAQKALFDFVEQLSAMTGLNAIKCYLTGLSAIKCMLSEAGLSAIN